MANSVDRTLIDGGLWEKATFTVPDSVSDERVQACAHKYMSRFGHALERQGFAVKVMLPPAISGSRLPIEGGRRRYDIFAWVTRRPVELTNDIPDILVPEMLRRGLRLK